MFAAWTVTLADLLLLFIYLEVLAMVAAYLGFGKLPVRMPLYIAMVALARYMILDMKSLDTWRMLGVAGAVLLITCAILVISYGQTRFPHREKDSNAQVARADAVNCAVWCGWWPRKNAAA